MPTPSAAALSAASAHHLGEAEDTIEIRQGAAGKNLVVGVLALLAAAFLLTKLVSRPGIVLAVLLLIALAVGIGSVRGWLKLRNQGVEQVTVFTHGIVHAHAKGDSASAWPWSQVTAHYSEREQKRDTTIVQMCDFRLSGGGTELTHRVVDAGTTEAAGLRQLHQRILRGQATQP